MTLSQLHNSKYYHWLYNCPVFPEKLSPSVWHPGIHRAANSTCCLHAESRAFLANQNVDKLSLSQHSNTLHGSLETRYRESSFSPAHLKPTIGPALFSISICLQMWEGRLNNIHLEGEVVRSIPEDLVARRTHRALIARVQG